MTVRYPRKKKRSPPPSTPKKKPTPITPEAVPYNEKIDESISFLNPVKKLGRPPNRIIPIEQQLDSASDELMLKIIKGDNIEQTGLTGKVVWAPASLKIRAELITTLLKKRRPDLQATFVKTENVNVESEEMPDDRQLSRLIGSLVYDAGIGDGATRAIEAPVDIMDTPTGSPETVSVARPKSESPSVERELPNSTEPVHGDRWEFESGAHVRYIVNEFKNGQFHLYNNLNNHCGFKNSWPAAEAQAKRLPIAEGMMKADPFEQIMRAEENAALGLGRPDANPLPVGRPRDIRNITRSPHAAWKPKRGFR